MKRIEFNRITETPIELLSAAQPIVDSFIHLLEMYQVLLKSKSFVSSIVMLRISISNWPFHVHDSIMDNQLTLFVLTSVFPQQFKWWPIYARISLLFNVRTQKSLSLCSTSRKLCFYFPLELFDFWRLNRSQHMINHFSIFLNMNFRLNTLNRLIQSTKRLQFSNRV